MKYDVSCSYCGHPQIYSPRGGKIPKKPHTDCKKCGKDFSINIEVSENIPKVPNLPKSKILKKVQAQVPPRIEKEFIDDPNELLMSVAIRELNRATPDPRWATILINCKKENITNKNLVLEEFKQLPTKALISLLNKNLQKEP